MKDINLENWKERLREEFGDDTFTVKADSEELFLAVRAPVLEYFIEELLRSNVQQLNKPK
jgi:hypothetical protein